MERYEEHIKENLAKIDAAVYTVKRNERSLKDYKNDEVFVRSKDNYLEFKEEIK